MKKTISKILLVGLIGILSLTAIVSASEVDYGAAGAMTKESYTLEVMLTYAIQDEYLAHAEYEKIMEKFGEQRPFANIIKAEEKHIELLEALFEKYNIEVPRDTAEEYATIPNSIADAMKAGIQAEKDNIAMYEKFLSKDLPEDIKIVFESLENASQNHLRAFERGSQGGDKTWSKNSGGFRGMPGGWNRYR